MEKGFENVLNKKINKNGYGDFSEAIKEIFRRRAEEYDLSDEVMKQEIGNFVRNVKKINVCEKMRHMVTGAYVRKLKRIFINYDYVKEFLEEGKISEREIYSIMYEALTHEVYHAISRKGLAIGLCEFSRETKSVIGTPLNEIFTETAANRTVFNKTSEDEKKCRMKTRLYSAITFATDLLGVSLGLTDKELLSAGIQNREELYKTLSKNYYEQDYKNDIFPNFQSIETNLDMIYNSIYTQENYFGLSYNLKSLYKKFYSIANMNLEKNKAELNDEYVQNIANSYQKMEIIMKDVGKDFFRRGFINAEAVKRINKEIDLNKMEYLTKVSDIIRFTKIKSQILDRQVMKREEKLAKQGRLSEDAEILKELYGIELIDDIEERKKCIDDEVSKYKSQDFSEEHKWDNEKMIALMKEIYDKKTVEIQRMENNFFYKCAMNIRNRIFYLKSGKIKKVAQANLVDGKCKEPESNFDEKYKVGTNELKPVQQNKLKDDNRDKDKGENQEKL